MILWCISRNIVRDINGAVETIYHNIFGKINQVFYGTFHGIFIIETNSSNLIIIKQTEIK